MLIPSTLAKAIVAGDCIPFVGAGISIAVRRNDGSGALFPSWKSLLLRSADRLDSEGKATEAMVVRSLVSVEQDPDYLYAAARARKSLGAVWYSFLSSELDPPAEAADQTTLTLARLVWGLNSRLVVTTNYDRVLNWTCPDSKNLQTWSIEAPAEMAAAMHSVKRPIVWHLHGTIGDAANLIITPDGYHRLYPSDAIEPIYEAALHSLQSILIRKTLLFIGFSGKDQHFAAQLRGMASIFKGAGGPHYILVHEKEVDTLRNLHLPLEPIVFRNYGEAQKEVLSRLSELSKTSDSILVSQEKVRKLKPSRRIVKETREIISELSATNIATLSRLSDVGIWDQKSIREFRDQLRPEIKSHNPDSLTEREFLLRLGCLQQDRLSLAGVLVFTSRPSAASAAALASAATQCVRYDGETKSAKRTREKLDGSVLSQMILARDFIASNIPRSEIPTAGSMKAIQSFKFPMVCIRELIANAICHRDYADQKRMTYVRIFSDRVEILSPGTWPALDRGPASGMAINRLSSQSIQENLPLSHLISMVSIVEMEGSGLPTAVRDCLDNNAPIPVAQLLDGYVMVTVLPCRDWDSAERPSPIKSIAVSRIEELLSAIRGATEGAHETRIMSLQTDLAGEYLRSGRVAEALDSANIAISIAERIGHPSRAGEARLIQYKAKSLAGRGDT